VILRMDVAIWTRWQAGKVIHSCTTPFKMV
jgi:hypothetical protein